MPSNAIWHVILAENRAKLLEQKFSNLLIFTLSGPLGSGIIYLKSSVLLNLWLGNVRNVKFSSIAHEQTQSNRFCCFQVLQWQIQRRVQGGGVLEPPFCHKLFHFHGKFRGKLDKFIQREPSLQI